VRLLVLGLLVCANLWPVAAQALAATATTTAFVHVNVVPMDRERVLRDQTVIVEGDKIVAMGPHLAVPANARMIDGHKTAYLSPGLADMHTHSETRNDLAIYLANGVTTVLQMGGARSAFVDSLVPAANAGEIPGPHVYASFLVDGSTNYNGFVIKPPAEARAIVGLAKTNRYDFIKVYVGLSPEVFAALADEGHRLGLPLVGHGVTAVRLENQLAAGQALVAHTEEFFYTFFTPPGAKESDVPPDTRRIPDAIALVQKYNATVTADLVTYAAIDHQIQHPDVIAAFLASPETAYLSPNDRLAWQRNDYVTKTAKLDAKLAFLRLLVKAMADAHIELVTGTDAPAIPGVLPGFSLHDDLDELEASGLTRFQALSAATRNPGTFIARTKGGDSFGIVATGYRADLILSTANPLDTLSTLRAPVGVMAHGQWWDAQALKGLTDSVRESYQRVSRVPQVSRSHAGRRYL
jgi:imidazolonepropionase-like amidohydrolase